jgi:hypothetical protein
MLTEIVAAIAFALVAIVVPGVAVQRTVWRRLDPALVVPLGLVWCAGAY